MLEQLLRAVKGAGGAPFVFLCVCGVLLLSIRSGSLAAGRAEGDPSTSSQPAARATASPAQPATPATPDPYELFVASVRAMRAAHARPMPAYLAYRLDVDTHNVKIMPQQNASGSTFEGTLDHADHHYAYQVWYRALDDRALTQDLQTHATVNHALFRPSAVALEDHSPGPTPAPKSLIGDTSGLAAPSLGSLSVASSRFYRISFAGTDIVAGQPAYHLHLIAMSDPREHPLTDLWIDPLSHLMRKASAAFSMHAVVAGGNGQGNAFFAPVAENWMLTAFDFSAKGYALLWHANVAMTVRARDIIPLEYLPDSYFGGPAVTPTPEPPTRQRPQSRS